MAPRGPKVRTEPRPGGLIHAAITAFDNWPSDGPRVTLPALARAIGKPGYEANIHAALRRYRPSQWQAKKLKPGRPIRKWNAEIGEHSPIILAAIKRQGIPLATIARDLGINLGKLKRWSKGGNYVRLYKLKAIAKYLGLVLEYTTTVTITDPVTLPLSDKDSYKPPKNLTKANHVAANTRTI